MENCIGKEIKLNIISKPCVNHFYGYANKMWSKEKVLLQKNWASNTNLKKLKQLREICFSNFKQYDMSITKSLNKIFGG